MGKIALLIVIQLAVAQLKKLSIIYQDADLVAVNKPSDMLCVPGLSSPENLFDSVKKEFPNARVVHRLDMATSGLVLFALNHPTQKQLGQLFETRQIKKTYMAIVEGIVKDDCGEIHSAILCDWPNRPKQKIDWLKGKQSNTQFNVIGRRPEKDVSRLRLIPHTGRTHQLRIHMQQIGHPIVGDALYSPSLPTTLGARLLLHAERLSFEHPIHSTALHLHCPALF